MAMAMASSSRTELILTSSPGRPITAYDTLSGDVIAEFPAANTPRHGLAVAGPAFLAASHVSPATAAGSVRLLRWCSPAAVHSLPTPEPVAPLAATPDGSHLFAGGMSGHVHALALQSGDVVRSFSAHKQAVSCLVLNDDGSLLVSGGDDGTVAVFAVLRVLDIDDDNSSNDLAFYRIAAHVAPVTCITSGHGGCDAIVVSSSTDGTCKLWSMANGSHKRTITFPCTVWSITLDPTSCYLYAGGSDGSVHVTFLKAHHANIVTWHEQDCNTSSNSNNVTVVGVALANECKNLVSCSEDGVVKVWNLSSGLVTSSFWINGVVSDVLVVKRYGGRVISGDNQVLNGVFGSNYDDEICRRVKEVEEMEEMLHVAEEDKKRAMELVEMAVDGYKRNLHLMLREVDACNNGKNDGD